MHTAQFTNPILPGGYPDPSICSVGDDFYLVNSSFEYFPGLPIHHSRDLINWTPIGHGLHRIEQCAGAVNLRDVQTRGGIHAPSLRYHDGTFYLITTNVYLPPGDDQPTQFINFVLTAENPAGPWSDPHIISSAPGIDPDIFFDDDDVWMIGTQAPERPNFPGEGEIWLQRLDSTTWTLTGERHFLWRGACSGVWAEGPHLYKHDGRYYLMIAEGGTSFNHAVMIAVSERITGPYLPNPRNPILSTRHLSYDHWVNSVGHGDLVQLPDGRWFMVALGIRNEMARGSNMGRETHLVPVVWEREPFEWQAVKYSWPVCAPKTGRVERLNQAPFAGTRQAPAAPFVDRFASTTLDARWNFRRVPLPGVYSLTARPGCLRLFARPETVRERGRYAWLGFRQTESAFDYAARIEFAPPAIGVEAGLGLLQTDDNYLNATVCRGDAGIALRLTAAEPGRPPRLLAQRPLPTYAGAIELSVASQDNHYHFAYRLPGAPAPTPFAETRADLILSRGYTGAYLGLYATSNGRPTNHQTAFMDVAWVRYRPFPTGERQPRMTRIARIDASNP